MNLADLFLPTVHNDGHRAVMRLILRTYAETHRIFRQTYGYIKTQIDGTADSEGMVEGPALMGRMAAIEDRYRADMRQWVSIFEQARAQAANIAFGELVVMHNAYMGGLNESRERVLTRMLSASPAHIINSLSEQVTAEQLAAAVAQAQAQGVTADQVGAMIRLWEERRNRALAAAANRVQDDGLTLSARIWRLENGGATQIRNTLLTAFAERTSATDLARRLEPVLGAGQDCPRWAYRRLYDMTASERAADSDGLLRDDECRATGISYNALRLARTEIQNAHHAMVSDIYQNAPWVTGKWVRLSPTHPRVDICDTYAAGGPYAADEVILSLHPNCLCRYEPALMPADDFRRSVRGWLAGENRFLDDYATWLGAPSPLTLLPWTMNLADSLELWLNTSRDAQAAALGVN